MNHFMYGLSSEQVSLLCRDYAETRNCDLMVRFGINWSQLRYLRLKYGLKKSDRMRRNLSRDYMGDEAYAAMLKLRGARIRELWRKDRRRVLFGLEQKTGLHVVRSSKAKYGLRWKMRKLGYVIGHGGNECLVTAGTCRSEALEDRACRMGMWIVEHVDEEEEVCDE